MYVYYGGRLADSKGFSYCVYIYPSFTIALDIISDFLMAQVLDLQYSGGRPAYNPLNLDKLTQKSELATVHIARSSFLASLKLLTQ